MESMTTAGAVAEAVRKEEAVREYRNAEKARLALALLDAEARNALEAISAMIAVEEVIAGTRLACA